MDSVRSVRSASGARDGGKQAGYTLVELIVVIVLLGILGAAAGPRFFDNQAFDERRYRDELASALRYAQKIAVASGCVVQVELGADTYRLRQQPPLAGHCDSASSAFSATVLLPTGEAAQGSAPSGLTLSPALTVRFDAQGRTNLANDQIFTIGAQQLRLSAANGLVTAL